MGGTPQEEWQISREIENRMAADLGANTLRYLPLDSVAKAIGLPPDHLCRACIDGVYPTLWGRKLSQEAFDEYQNDPKRLEGQTFGGPRLGLLGGN
jgi:glutamine phosphoribosylpyrophosphate amidotransferase